MPCSPYPNRVVIIIRTWSEAFYLIFAKPNRNSDAAVTTATFAKRARVLLYIGERERAACWLPAVAVATIRTTYILYIVVYIYIYIWRTCEWRTRGVYRFSNHRHEHIGLSIQFI